MRTATMTIEVIRYFGLCPKCGVEQDSTSKHMVDILCSKCELQEYRNEYSFLVDSKIVSFDNYGHTISELVIIDKNNNKYYVTADSSGRFEIEKVYE